MHVGSLNVAAKSKESFEHVAFWAAGVELEVEFHIVREDLGGKFHVDGCEIILGERLYLIGTGISGTGKYLMKGVEQRLVSVRISGNPNNNCDAIGHDTKHCLSMCPRALFELLCSG